MYVFTASTPDGMRQEFLRFLAHMEGREEVAKGLATGVNLRMRQARINLLRQLQSDLKHAEIVADESLGDESSIVSWPSNL